MFLILSEERNCLKIGFYIKQLIKMAVQHIFLPFLYFIFSRGKINDKSVIFADAHHSEIPFSMEQMRKSVGEIDGLEIHDMYFDFQKNGTKSLILWLVKFMKVFAKARYVFICDNFLPVSSCRKRPETTVVQLWHSGGLLKKAGYDTDDSVPDMYKGNVFKNYDLLTVSAPCCVKVFESSCRQPQGVVKALGISRSDIYFNEEFNRTCREEFYRIYPEALGKRIVLWAPTFRGNAAEPVLIGEDAIDRAFKEMPDCFLVKKLHPHFENKNFNKISCMIPSEKLFAVADLLITDYSSIVFDYLAYKKPFVLFAPDLDEYEKEHGFYLSYETSYPTTFAKNEQELVDAVKYELTSRNVRELEECYAYHMKMCDGKATQRILREIGLK